MKNLCVLTIVVLLGCSKPTEPVVPPDNSPPPLLPPVAWQKVNLPATVAKGVIPFLPKAVHIDSLGNIFVGGAQGAIITSRDSGSSWKQGAQTSAINRFRGGDSLLCLSQYALFKYADSIWTKRDTITNVGVNSVYFNDFAFSAGSAFCVTTNAVYRSTRWGQWQQVYFQNVTSHSNVWKIAVSPKGHLFVRTLDKIIRSTDNGSTWLDVMPHPASSLGGAMLFLGDTILAAFKDTAWVSTNDGASWQTFSHGLPLGQDPAGNWGFSLIRLAQYRNRILAGTNFGIFALADSAGVKTWTSLGTAGMGSDLVIRYLIIDRNNNAYVITNDGLFKGALRF